MSTEFLEIIFKEKLSQEPHGRAQLLPGWLSHNDFQFTILCCYGEICLTNVQE